MRIPRIPRLSGMSALALVGLAIAALPLACDKPDPLATAPDAMVVQTVTNPSTNGTSVATSLPTGAAPGGDTDAAFGAAASTTVAPSEEAGTAMTTAATADAAASPAKARHADSHTTGTAAATAAAPVACGDAPLPPCPLYAWMKAKAGPAAGHADADPSTLAAVFDQIATFAPPGYPNWVSISKDGAAAARAGQSDAAKASCRGCHTQYKTRYKAEMRGRPLS